MQLKETVKERFKIPRKKFVAIWNVRASINGMGRFQNFQTRNSIRQEEVQRHEQEQHQRREDELTAQVASLQNEVNSMRNAASNYIFSQLH